MVDLEKSAYSCGESDAPGEEKNLQTANEELKAAKRAHCDIWIDRFGRAIIFLVILSFISFIGMIWVFKTGTTTPVGNKLAPVTEHGKTVFVNPYWDFTLRLMAGAPFSICCVLMALTLFFERKKKINSSMSGKK